jgi:LPXTG-site transpeptidase (sortase) family protein
VSLELASVDTRVDVGDDTAHGLDAAHSAAQILDPRQRQVLITASLLLVAILLLAPLTTVIVIMAITVCIYFAVVCQRLLITKRSLEDTQVVTVSDEEARAIPDHDLPIYTVLVPAYREAQVVEALAGHLRDLEYPRDRLDLKLLLEADDYETIDAAKRAAPDLQVVLVPPGEPRTKPKALNAGFATAHGEYVTIYDAEDIPDPLQLRRAVAGFRRLPANFACLQAQLTFHNWNHNIITRWFTIEYMMWFTLFLPGLSSMDAPVPLGGTSNHIRREVLDEVGTWDPYNVTEDADLGIRLHAHGWRTAVLNSDTLEEPNSDFVNWVKQRSRWYKGYLQTWLVNLRRPIKLWRALGPGGFVQFNLFVGGTPLLSLLNPFFWLLTIVWFLGHASIIEAIFPAPLYHLALFCWIVGNLAVFYVTILAARRSGRNSLVWAACLVPVYWVMMSMAAIKAFWQVLAAPSFWEKTTHGLAVEGASIPTVLTADGVPVAREAFRAFPPDPRLPAWSPAAADASAMVSTSGATTLTAPRDRGTSGNGDGRGSAWAPTVGPNGNGTGVNTSLADFVPPPAPPLAASARVERVPRPSRWVAIGRCIRAAGLVVALFVGYLVVGTAWRADQAQATLRHGLTVAPIRTPRVGTPLARLKVAAAGIDVVVVEGTGSSELDRGPGHVPGSANPGGAGNVVVVGHRVVAAAPFSHLGQLRRGDPIDLVAPWGRARYRVVDVANRSNRAIDLSSRGAPRLTLVSSAKSLAFSDHLVVDARLISAPLHGTPVPTRQLPRLPRTDLTAVPVFAAAALAGLLAWYARRWLVPVWGRLRATLVVTPLVVIALLEAFAAAVRLLPATF